MEPDPSIAATLIIYLDAEAEHLDDDERGTPR
jgi:hypothetical protein